MSGLQAAFSDTCGLQISHRGRGALRTPTPHPTTPSCSGLPRTRGGVLTDVGEERGGWTPRWATPLATCLPTPSQASVCLWNELVLSPVQRAPGPHPQRGTQPAGDTMLAPRLPHTDGNEETPAPRPGRYCGLTSGVFFLNSRLCSISRFLDCSLSSCRFASTVAVASSSLCGDTKGRTRSSLRCEPEETTSAFGRTQEGSPVAMGSLGSRAEGAGGGGGEEVDTEAVPLQSMHWSQKTRMAQLGVPCFHAHEHLLPGQNTPKRFSLLNPAICLSSTAWAGSLVAYHVQDYPN